MAVKTRPVSRLASTLVPGTQELVIRFTSATVDMTGATSGRFIHLDSEGHPAVDALGAVIYWDATVSGTPTTREAVLVHAFGADDLTAAMENTDVPMRGLCTVNGVELLDEPLPFLLPVVP